MGEFLQQPRFHFSRRSLFFVVIPLCAIGLAWLAWNANLVRARMTTLELVTNRGGWYGTASIGLMRLRERRWIMPALRTVVGDELVYTIALDPSMEDQLDAIARLFPEAEVGIEVGTAVIKGSGVDSTTREPLNLPAK